MPLHDAGFVAQRSHSALLSAGSKQDVRGHCSKLTESEPHTHSLAAGLTVNLPRLGLSLPASTLMAVDLPMPFVPTKPSTCPGRGIGNLHPYNVLS